MRHYCLPNFSVVGPSVPNAHALSLVHAVAGTLAFAGASYFVVGPGCYWRSCFCLYIPQCQKILVSGARPGSLQGPHFYGMEECSVVDLDPGSGAFLTPGSGIRDPE
jgi:hypothetical protein